MNPLDDQLDRLLRAAAQATGDATLLPPFGLETRVLAAWRMRSSSSPWTMGLLVRGLILASVIMGLSLLPVLDKASTPDADYLQLADSTLQVDNNL